MDLKDEHCGRMEEIYEQLRSAYNQAMLMHNATTQSESSSQHEDKGSPEISEDMEKGMFDGGF